MLQVCSKRSWHGRAQNRLAGSKDHKQALGSMLALDILVYKVLVGRVLDMA
jgi:hypothetical protein